MCWCHWNLHIWFPSYYRYCLMVTEGLTGLLYKIYIGFEIWVTLTLTFKVKIDSAIGLPIYDFLLVSNNNLMCTSHHLAVIAVRKCFSYLFIIGLKFHTPDTHPCPGVILSQNLITSYIWVRGKDLGKN